MGERELNVGVPTHELVKALRELYDAVEMGQFKFKPGSRGQEEAARALAQAKDVLQRMRKPMGGMQ